ncbi:MAG: class I SAM-dependent methyltransferase [Oscillospiraceae bacterium]
MNTKLQQATDFDLNPPIELNKYDESIRQFCAAYEPMFFMACSFIRSMVKDNAELLIVGCGTGMELISFGLENPLWNMTGVDPSVEMLSIAKQKIDENHLLNSIQLFHGYTHDLPESNLYDAATCILVMHFLSDDGAKLHLLKSISQRLKSGSPLILIDGFGNINSNHFEQTVLAWKTFVKSMGVEDKIVEDGFNNQILKRIQFVEEERIKSLLTEAGFDESLRFFTSFAYGGWIAIKK